jgi:hypothetical protein
MLHFLNQPLSEVINENLISKTNIQIKSLLMIILVMNALRSNEEIFTGHSSVRRGTVDFKTSAAETSKDFSRLQETSKDFTGLQHWSLLSPSCSNVNICVIFFRPLSTILSKSRIFCYNSSNFLVTTC